MDDDCSSVTACQVKIVLEQSVSRFLIVFQCMLVFTGNRQGILTRGLDGRYDSWGEVWGGYGGYPMFMFEDQEKKWGWGVGWKRGRNGKKDSSKKIK